MIRRKWRGLRGWRLTFLLLTIVFAFVAAAPDGGHSGGLFALAALAATHSATHASLCLAARRRPYSSGTG